jgi:hypothetical protein
LFGSDSIVLKYRTVVLNPNNFGYNPVSSTFVGGGGTMASANSFTTTFDMSLVSVGDEIQFIELNNGGFTAHITGLSKVSTTWTVTLDENFADTSGTIVFVCLPFKKIGTISSAVKQSIDNSFPLQTGAEWIQLKIEGRGKTPVIKDILLQTETNIKALNPKGPLE